jgi:hypothetical protein
MGEETYIPIDALSSKVRVILRWLLSKAVQETINSGCNWKITVHCSGPDIKAVIEKYEKIS